MLTANTPCIPSVFIREPDPCFYPNCLKTMDCFVSEKQPSPKERLLASGLDEATVDAYLSILDSYKQAIDTAESDYRNVVMECTAPPEPSGRAEHHIISAYYKRTSDYAKAAETMLEQIRQLAEKSGYPVATM